MKQPLAQIPERVEAIKPLLAGLPPDIQGSILADLTAIWLAAHPPHIRPKLLALQCRTIRALIIVNEEILFGDAGHPAARANN